MSEEGAIEGSDTAEAVTCADEVKEVFAAIDRFLMEDAIRLVRAYDEKPQCSSQHSQAVKNTAK